MLKENRALSIKNTIRLLFYFGEDLIDLYFSLRSLLLNFLADSPINTVDTVATPLDTAAIPSDMAENNSKNLSRYRLQCTLQPCRGGSMLFRTHISCNSVAFLGTQAVQHPPFFLEHSLYDKISLLII